MRKQSHDAALAYLLNLPSLLLILALIAYPVIYSLVISLYRYNLRDPKRISFIGLGNYFDVLSDPLFWTSLEKTAYFCIASVLLVILIGTGIALLFNQTFAGRGLARAMLLIPWALPGVVNGLMWKGMFNPYGGINALLHKDISWLSGTKVGFIEGEWICLGAVCAAHVWKEVPFATVVFLATLQAIPKDLYAAAWVDGAGGWRRFWHVTLPWLLPAIIIVAIFETMTSFRAFDIFFTLTGGGPGRATWVIAWQTYKQAFTFLNFGAANAYCYVIALITVTLSIIYIRLLYRRGAMIQ